MSHCTPPTVPYSRVSWPRHGYTQTCRHRLGLIFRACTGRLPTSGFAGFRLDQRVVAMAACLSMMGAHLKLAQPAVRSLPPTCPSLFAAVTATLQSDRQDVSSPSIWLAQCAAKRWNDNAYVLSWMSPRPFQQPLKNSRLQAAGFHRVMNSFQGWHSLQVPAELTEDFQLLPNPMPVAAFPDVLCHNWAVTSGVEGVCCRVSASYPSIMGAHLRLAQPAVRSLPPTHPSLCSGY